jgi:GntR family transcriptional regulator
LEGDVELLASKTGEASAEERTRLQLPVGARVIRLERRRCDRGTPFMLERVVLPQAGFDGLVVDAATPHEIPILAQHFGHIASQFVEEVRPYSADSRVAGLLSIAVGAPLLELDRIVLTQRAQIEWRLAWCHLIDGSYLYES